MLNIINCLAQFFPTVCFYIIHNLKQPRPSIKNEMDTH